MKVAIFARVSTTDKQTTERQVNDLRDLCTAQGWTIVATITEQVSGAKSNDDRAGLQQVFDLAQRRQISKVIIYGSFADRAQCERRRPNNRPTDGLRRIALHSKYRHGNTTGGRTP